MAMKYFKNILKNIINFIFIFNYIIKIIFFKNN